MAKDKSNMARAPKTWQPVPAKHAHWDRHQHPCWSFIQLGRSPWKSVDTGCFITWDKLNPQISPWLYIYLPLYLRNYLQTQPCIQHSIFDASAWLLFDTENRKTNENHHCISGNPWEWRITSTWNTMEYTGCVPSQECLEDLKCPTLWVTSSFFWW